MGAQPGTYPLGVSDPDAREPAAHEPAAPLSAPGPNHRLRHGIRCGCLGVLLLLPAWGLAAYHRAGRLLDREHQRVSAEVAERRAALAAERPPVFGEPRPGNAADDYVAAFYLLSAGDPSARSPRWQEDPPLVPASAVAIAQQLEGCKPVDALMSSEIYAHLDTGAPIKSTTLAVIASYRPALRFVREGAHRERCSWDFPWQDGWNADVPNLIDVRTLGGLLALEAEQDSDPRRALRGGLELLGFARDLGRHPSLISRMIGVALSQAGVRSLCQTYGRPGLEREDYELAARALARLAPNPTDEAFVNERLLTRINLLADSGRPLQSGVHSSLGGLYQFDLVAAWELANLERIDRRTRALLSGPRGPRLAGFRQLEREVEGAPSLLLEVYRANWSEAQDHIWEERAALDAARVLAAAHLYRLEQGRFPASSEALVPRLGQVPRDRFGEGPLRLILDPQTGELCCYSVGRNGVDEGGSRRGDADDLAARTSAPAE